MIRKEREKKRKGKEKTEEKKKRKEEKRSYGKGRDEKSIAESELEERYGGLQDRDFYRIPRKAGNCGGLFKGLASRGN